MIEIEKGRNDVAEFEPRLGSALVIGAKRYGFMPHPLLPPAMDEVYVIEGGEALIYQVQDLETGQLWALKVSKPTYRNEQIARATAALAPYSHIPGLYLAQRLCLTREAYPELIAATPSLEYAVLMPWIAGRTWAGLLLDRAASESYTPLNALNLAIATSQLLWELEAHHLAHTDIAGANIVLAPDFREVELLDIDNLYTPNAPLPKRQSWGTPGYQHRNLGKNGHWRPEGDRFAGAILLSEMLSWWDPPVRQQTPIGAESLFQPRELQEYQGPRWQALRDALYALCPPVLTLFDQAWASDDLADCPDFGTWTLALIQYRDSGALNTAVL